MAFIARPPLVPALSRGVSCNSTKFVCSASRQEDGAKGRVSRRALLSGAAAALLAVVGAGAAEAKNGTGAERAFSKEFFPKPGFNAPDQAGKATVDKNVLSTKEAKKALDVIKSYDQAIADMFTKFQKDPQIEVAGPVRKMVNISDLRNALNIVNEAIDEDGQVLSDKVVRGIIQDIGELETAAYVKQGGTRTNKKIERTTDWFDKLQGDFTRLLAFYS